MQEPSTVSNDESTLPPRIDNQLCFRILFSHCLFAKLIAYVNLCTKAKVSKMLEYCILAFICQIVLFVCTFNELFAPYLMRFETHAYPHTHTHVHRKSQRYLNVCQYESKYLEQPWVVLTAYVHRDSKKNLVLVEPSVEILFDIDFDEMTKWHHMNNEQRIVEPTT